MSKQVLYFTVVMWFVALGFTAIGMREDNFLFMGTGGMVLGGLSMLLFSEWRERKVG